MNLKPRRKAGWSAAPRGARVVFDPGLARTQGHLDLKRLTIATLMKEL